MNLQYSSQIVETDTASLEISRKFSTFSPHKVDFFVLRIVSDFLCVFYNNTSRFSFGVFTAELICMQRWDGELS